MTSVYEMVFSGVRGRWCVFTCIRGGMSEAVFRSLDDACIKRVPLLGIHFAQVKMEGVMGILYCFHDIIEEDKAWTVNGEDSGGTLFKEDGQCSVFG